jgi:hypothetical protein
MKDYLGDGVYADFDGYMIQLTSENGEAVLEEIYLEPQVFAALERYAARCWPNQAIEKGTTS